MVPAQTPQYLIGVPVFFLIEKNFDWVSRPIKNSKLWISRPIKLIVPQVTALALFIYKMSPVCAVLRGGEVKSKYLGRS